MKVCGIEIKSNQATITVLEINGDEVTLIDTTVKKFTLTNDENQSSMNSFKDAVLNFLKGNDVERVAIKQRAQSGKFGGGGLTFKIEAIIQLFEKEVKIINGKTIATKTKNIDLAKFKVNKNQEEALKTALSII